MAKVYRGSHYHLIDCLGSNFLELLSVMAWLAITSLTERTLLWRKKYPERSIHNKVWDTWIFCSYISVVYESEFPRYLGRIYVSFHPCNFLYSWEWWRFDLTAHEMYTNNFWRHFAQSGFIKWRIFYVGEWKWEEKLLICPT